MLTIGAHMSIAKGIAKAAENVIKMQANTMQIFSRNPRGSSYKDYSRAEVDKFQTLRKDHEFGALLAHAPYTMNACAADPGLREFAQNMMRDDLARLEHTAGDLRVCLYRDPGRYGKNGRAGS